MCWRLRVFAAARDKVSQQPSTQPEAYGALTLLRGRLPLLGRRPTENEACWLLTLLLLCHAGDGTQGLQYTEKTACLRAIPSTRVSDAG